MTIDIERLKHDLDYWNSVAPEGATHYIIDDDDSPLAFPPAFHRDEGDKWQECAKHGYWDKDTSNPLTVIPRPSPAWDGSGLPPVGVECEVNAGGDSGYSKCVVVAHHFRTRRPIVDFLTMTSSLTHAPECWKFRPLKTEKERLVEYVMDVAGFGENMRHGLKKAYDAGCLKMPGGESRAEQGAHQ